MAMPLDDHKATNQQQNRDQSVINVHTGEPGIVGFEESIFSFVHPVTSQARLHLCFAFVALRCTNIVDSLHQWPESHVLYEMHCEAQRTAESNS